MDVNKDESFTLHLDLCLLNAPDWIHQIRELFAIQPPTTHNIKCVAINTFTLLAWHLYKNCRSIVFELNSLNVNFSCHNHKGIPLHTWTNYYAKYVYLYIHRFKCAKWRNDQNMNCNNFQTWKASKQKFKKYTLNEKLLLSKSKQNEHIV